MQNAMYSIAAVDPATGHVVELEIVAANPGDAKARAEHSGLKFVVVRTAPGPAAPPERGVRFPAE